jgi:hypothetical protein
MSLLNKFRIWERQVHFRSLAKKMFLQCGGKTLSEQRKSFYQCDGKIPSVLSTLMAALNVSAREVNFNAL